MTVKGTGIVPAQVWCPVRIDLTSWMWARHLMPLDRYLLRRRSTTVLSGAHATSGHDGHQEEDQRVDDVRGAEQRSGMTEDAEQHLDDHEYEDRACPPGTARHLGEERHNQQDKGE